MYRLPDFNCKIHSNSVSFGLAGLVTMLILGLFCSCRSPYCMETVCCGTACENASLRCETTPKCSSVPSVNSSPRFGSKSCNIPACKPACAPTCAPAKPACVPSCAPTKPACVPVQPACAPVRRPTPAPSTAADSVLNDPQIPVEEKAPEAQTPAPAPAEAPEVTPESSTPMDLFAEPSAERTPETMMKPIENRAGVRLLEAQSADESIPTLDAPESVKTSKTPAKTPVEIPEMPDLEALPMSPAAAEEEFPTLEALPALPEEENLTPAAPADEQIEALPETLDLSPVEPQAGRKVPVQRMLKKAKTPQKTTQNATTQNATIRKNISIEAIRNAAIQPQSEIQQVSYTPSAQKNPIQLTAGEIPVSAPAAAVTPAAPVTAPVAAPVAPAAPVSDAQTDVQSPMPVLPERPTFAQPADEYIVDSNHSASKRELKNPQKVKIGGVEMNDNMQFETQDQTGTFLYYDSVQGRTTVQSPNPVYIYAPRFRSVRQVVDLNIDEQVLSTSDVYTPTETSVQERSTGTDTAKQHAQVGTESSRAVMIQAEGSANTGLVEGDLAAQSQNQEVVAAQESRINVGPTSMNGKTRVWTARGLDLVNTWSKNEELQVFIDQESASASVRVESVPSIYSVKEGEQKQDVKIYKVSSQTSAAPGETVDFIIYFENTGHAPVGNIVLVDSLPARLEIVEDSAESSVDATFSYEINNTGSQTLRWTITQPLYAGEKGAVKFKALVR